MREKALSDERGMGSGGVTRPHHVPTARKILTFARSTVDASTASRRSAEVTCSCGRQFRVQVFVRRASFAVACPGCQGLVIVQDVCR